MKIFRCIILLIICSVSLSAYAQSLSSSVQASAGGSFESDQLQLNWTVGQPFNGTVAGNGISILTQGFQQPELQVWTSYVGNMIFPGKELKVPYKASGVINDNNTYTAQLSDKEGNFNHPVNIGTFRGSMNGQILSKIPSDATPGTKYRVRVISSSSPFTGTDNGSPLSLKKALSVKVLPNPSTSVFNIYPEGASDEPITVRVLSVNGKVLNMMNGRDAKGFMRFGADFRPGAYFVEIVQGDQRVIVKLVKLPY